MSFATIKNLSVIAGLITALFAIVTLWDQRGWVTKQEHNAVKRELSIHIIESRLMIMRREVPADPADRRKHEEQMGRLQGILDKLHRADVRSYYALD